MSIETRLKKILGEQYGGPSLSYEDGLWSIYKWYDAPFQTDTLGAGPTIKAAIENYEQTLKAREKLTGKKRRKK